MRLVLVSDAKGVPLGYDLVFPKDRSGARVRLRARPGAPRRAVLRRRLLGAEYERTMELIDIELVT
jgi:hypothetical protein